MNKLYAWDEISNELQQREPEELFRCSAEGGWLSEGWLEHPQHDSHPVEIRSTDRHISLETWAESADKAHSLFMLHPTYRDYHTED